MTATAGIGRLMPVILSVTVSLAVTTCDIQTNSAVLHNESGEDGLTWQLMSAPGRVNTEQPFVESVGFPGTRAGGCVEHSWGWRIVDQDDSVLVERTFEQDPVCSGDTLVYEGDGIVREAG